jgi:hypothetical protein
LVVTQFKKDVTIGSVLKEMFVFANVLVFQCTVDLNLRLQLEKVEGRKEAVCERRVVRIDNTLFATNNENKIVSTIVVDIVPFDEPAS